jgi:hypothetical protein
LFEEIDNGSLLLLDESSAIWSLFSAFTGVLGTTGSFGFWSSSVDNVDPGELSWGTNGVYLEASLLAGGFDGGVDWSGLALG